VKVIEFVVARRWRCSSWKEWGLANTLRRNARV